MMDTQRGRQLQLLYAEIAGQAEVRPTVVARMSGMTVGDATKELRRLGWRRGEDADHLKAPSGR